MTYYHQTKAKAEAAAVIYEDHWIIQTTLVPDNGWVITLYPKTQEVYKWPLYDLLDRVELRLGYVIRRPDSYNDWRKNVAPESRPTRSGGPPPAPPPPPLVSPAKPVALVPPPPPPVR